MAKSAINFIDTRLKPNRAIFFAIATGIFLLAAGSGLFGFYSYGKFSSEKQQVAGTSTTQTLPKDWLLKYFGTDNENDAAVGGANGDPDNDAMPNFEEYAFGTDPTNPDSDGDGAIDGAEVDFNKNPLGEGDLNVTTPMAEDYLKSLGPEYEKYNEKNIQKDLEAMFQPNREVVLDLPDDKDLILTNNNDKAGFEKYYEDTKGLGTSDDAEITKVYDSLFELSPQELDGYIQKLEAMIKVLQETPVPSAIADIHKLRIAQLRAGIKMFELVRDNYHPNSSNTEFWADYFQQVVAVQVTDTLQLLAWKQLFDALKAQGGL